MLWCTMVGPARTAAGSQRRTLLWLSVLVMVLSGATAGVVYASTLVGGPGLPAPVGPSAAPAPPATTGSPSSSHAPLFPPRIVSAIGNCTTTPVVPGCGYPSEPAPMGIADYGVSGYGHPTPYAYGTTRFLGNFSWTQAYIDSSGSGASFSVQLNVVLNFINGGKNYSYWIQDVPVPVDSTPNVLQMSYADNIWNFSCTTSTCNVASSTLSGNGSLSGGVYIWPASANSGCAGGKSGVCDTLTGPSYFQVEVRTFLNANGEPVVRFCYADAKTVLSCYDTVTFTFAKRVSTFRGFFVDGFSMNPTGLFENAELTIGGPGGGASTTNAGPTNIQTSLDFWNGHNYQAVPASWNAGDDTAEAISSDQSVFSNDGSGTPFSVQMNGTTREAFENPTYTLGQVGTLQLWAPGTTTGRVAVGHQDWGYTNGDATLTLVPGTYHVWDNSTTSVDMGMCTITAAATLNVSTSAPCTSGGGLSVSAPTASATSVDVGQTVSFSTTATGGSGTYTGYAWTASPASGLACTAATTTPSTTCTASASGSYTVQVTVTDSGGLTASATSAALPVYPDPTTSIPSPSSTSISLGQSVTFTTQTGLPGSGGDTYTWSASPSSTAGCTASTSTTYTCTPTAAGGYTATATVKDSNGGTGSNTSASVQVTAGVPTVSAPTPTPAGSVDVGQSVSWSASVTGGTTPYTYSWTTAPATGLGCPSSGAYPVSCVPTAAGSYTLTLKVTDAQGATASASSSAFQVYALPSVSAPSPSSTAPTVGKAFALASQLTSPGSGGDSYLWTFSAPALGCTGANALSVSCTPTAPGTYTATIAVTDSNGGTASTTSASITVSTVSTLSAAIAVNPATGTAPLQVTFTGSAQGGSPGYTWAWSFGDQSTSTLQDPSHTYSSAGSFTVSLTVTDSTGATAQASTTIVVGAPSGVLSVNAQATPNPATAGATIDFTANVQGGSGSYIYSWHFGDGSLSSLAAPTHAYSAVGNYTVVLFVNDSQGAQGRTSFTVSVGAATSAPASTSAGIGPDLWWILLGVVAVVGVALALVLLRRRSGAVGDPGPGATGAPAGWEPSPLAPSAPLPASSAGPAPRATDEVAPDPFGSRYGPGGPPPGSR